MQFDKDIEGKFSDIFIKLRDMILSIDGIKEKKNIKRTSFNDEYYAICFLRSDDEKLILSLSKGAILQKSFPSLKGNGRFVRDIYLKTIDDLDENLIRELMKKSMTLNLEDYELKNYKFIPPSEEYFLYH